jgi:hypothetical protein
MNERSFSIGRYTHTIRDLHPRDGIRWAVGSKVSRRSSTWRLWGHKKGDAYLAMRSMGGLLKVSIHRDRRCNVGFTSEFAKQAQEQFGTRVRHWHRWKLPDAPMVRAFQVVIPDSELAEFDEEDTEPMAWIPAPGAGQAAVFTLFVAEPPNEFRWNSPEESGQLIGTMICPTRFTWLVHHNQSLDNATLEMIENGRRRAEEHAGAKLKNAPPDGLRMVLWGHRDAAQSDPFFVETDAARLSGGSDAVG